MAEMQRERDRLIAEEKAEEERLAAIMEEEQAALEAAAEQRRQAAEARELDSLTGQWASAIASKVEGLWRKPPSAGFGESCVIYVRQTSGGAILAANVRQCTGNEEFRQSVEAAVYKADPLPPAPNAEVFQQELLFRFDPEG